MCKKNCRDCSLCNQKCRASIPDIELPNQPGIEFKTALQNEMYGQGYNLFTLASLTGLSVEAVEIFLFTPSLEPTAIFFAILGALGLSLFKVSQYLPDSLAGDADVLAEDEALLFA